MGQTPSYGVGVTFAPLAELLAQAAGSPSGEAEIVAGRLGQRLTAYPAAPDTMAAGTRKPADESHDCIYFHLRLIAKPPHLHGR